MKKIVTIVLLIAVIAAAVVFVPKLAHTCDSCEKFFVGPGYEPFVVLGLVSEEEQYICKECAEEQHALEILAGQSVEDFQKKLFD